MKKKLINIYNTISSIPYPKFTHDIDINVPVKSIVCSQKTIIESIKKLEEEAQRLEDASDDFNLTEEEYEKIQIKLISIYNKIDEISSKCKHPNIEYYTKKKTKGICIDCGESVRK